MTAVVKVRIASGANRVYIISTTRSNIAWLRTSGAWDEPHFGTQPKEALFISVASNSNDAEREAGLLSAFEKKWAKVKLNWIFFFLLPRLASFLLRLLSFTGSQLSIHRKINKNVTHIDYSFLIIYVDLTNSFTNNVVHLHISSYNAQLLSFFVSRKKIN